MTRYPVDTIVIASSYLDPRRNPPHYGVDLAGKPGDAVRAPERMSVVATAIAPDPGIDDNTNFEPCLGLAGGLVCKARDRKWAPWTGYGPGVVVGKGASGRYHLLAHLGAVSVRAGQLVDEGEAVGSLASHVGGSASHVHWEVRDVAVDDGPKSRDRHTVNPVEWVATHGSAAIAPSSGPLLWLLLLWAVSRAM